MVKILVDKENLTKAVRRAVTAVMVLHQREQKRLTFLFVRTSKEFLNLVYVPTGDSLRTSLWIVKQSDLRAKYL